MAKTITIKMPENIYDGGFRSIDKNGDKKLLKNLNQNRELVSALQHLAGIDTSYVLAILLREAIRILPIAVFKIAKSNELNIISSISRLSEIYEDLYFLLISLTEKIKENDFYVSESDLKYYDELTSTIYNIRDGIYRPIGVFTYRTQIPSFQFYPLTLIAVSIEAFCSAKTNPDNVLNLGKCMFFSYSRSLNMQDCCSHYEIHRDIYILENRSDIKALLSSPLWSGYQFMDSRFVEMLLDFECTNRKRFKRVVESYRAIGFGEKKEKSYSDILLVESKIKKFNMGAIMHTLSFPNFNSEVLTITLNAGEIAFVIGENGSGKSALMHHFYKWNGVLSKRIFAHRKMSIKSNLSQITDIERSNAERNIVQSDMQSNARYSDNTADQKLMLAISDLTNAETLRAFKITQALDSGKQELASEISKVSSHVQIINSVFSNARIPIEISIGSDRQIFASKNGGAKYSIVEMSDGEKNALLMSIEILTARNGTLIVIDEPELHLHPSISSPLLLDLFSRRSDCSYIVSTHDLELLADDFGDNIIVTQDCQWNSGEAVRWNAHIIKSPKEIDQNIKSKIKGGRKNILFVEGERSGPDVSIYNILFPSLSVVPCGSCTDVINSVHGLNGVAELTWLTPLGLIDSDGHNAEKLEALKKDNIFSLPYYAVESLYYRKIIISEILSNIEPLYIDKKIGEIESLIKKEASKLREQMCAAICEKHVRAKIMTSLPKKADILKGGEMPCPSIDYSKLLEDEYKIFDEFIKNDVFGILGRYKIKSLVRKIAEACGFKNESMYQKMVITSLVKNANLRDQIRMLLGDIVYKIDSL